MSGGVASTQHACRLFTIPPEMRNRIYREVLVEGEIDIEPGDATLPTEPNLLNTCRAIRDEALGIYYLENKFRFTIVDNNAADLIKWFTSARRRCEANVTIRVRLSANWPNTLVWAEAVYRRKCCTLGSSHGGRKNRVVHHVLRVAFHLRNDNVPWQRVKLVLEEIRGGLALENEKWAEGDVEEVGVLGED